MAPANRRGPFYALKFRNFRLFFIGQIISVAGTWMQTVAQNWFVWELTKSAGWLGVVNGASAIPYVAFALWGGQIADRHSRRNILVWSQTASMILAFVLAVIATNRWVHPMAWHVAVISAFSSVVSAFNMPAQQAFVTDMVDTRDALANAIALNSLRFNLARFIGPILAGIVLARSNATLGPYMGAALCFFLNGLSFIAVIISLLMMRVPPAQARPRKESIWTGFRYIAQTRRVLRVVLMMGFGALFTWPVSTLFPVFATLTHHGASGYSALMSYNGIGAAAGGVALAVWGDYLPRRFSVYGGAALFAVALIALSCTLNYRAELAIVAISGFAMIIFGISCNTLVQEQVPDDLRGRVMAVYSLVFQGMFPIGGLEFGTLAGKIGAEMTVRVNAIAGLVVVAAIYLWSILDRQPPVPAAISAPEGK
jgi:MFS family permease